MEANDQRSNDEILSSDIAEQQGSHRTSYVEQDREMSRSPHVTFEIIHDDVHRDDASFGLYNSSFDTLSDNGAALLLGVNESTGANPAHRYENPTTNRSGNRIFATPAITHGQDPNDIDLPELHSPCYNLESSEMSLGDLSPIKLIYSEGSAPRIERRAASHSTDTFHNNGSDFDWRSDEINLSYTCSRSNPFYVLRSASKAFTNVRYLLPCLRFPTSEANAITMSNFGSIRQYKGVMESKENSADLMISIRRVESAICAFGGTLHPNPTQCIDDSFQNGDNADDSRTGAVKNHSPASRSENSCSKHVNNRKNIAVLTKNDQLHINDLSRKSSQNSSTASSDGASDDLTKLKYRCKRCGQLKQNHVCPYQQPLQRSIGIMVYPAVNSYSAAEPGVIAPSLSKMNNFISYDDSDQGGDPPSDHVTQQRPKVEDGNPFVGHGMTVTPESLRGTLRGETHFHSPQSSLSAQSSDDPVAHHIGPLNSSISKHDCRRLLKRPHSHLMESSTSPSHYESTRNAMFVASVSLRPEQYRAVTPFTKEGPVQLIAATSNSITECTVGPETTLTTPINAATSKILYQYPAVPLSFSERKRMSDTLFYLSQEIPTVTSDCATILRTARQNKEWDLAVAELLTQVVVALYCGEGDLRLDGLQQFLLSLGISC